VRQFNYAEEQCDGEDLRRAGIPFLSIKKLKTLIYIDIAISSLEVK
jgi:hypothetical protein